jgi:hypothetical protein
LEGNYGFPDGHGVIVIGTRCPNGIDHVQPLGGFDTGPHGSGAEALNADNLSHLEQPAGRPYLPLWAAGRRRCAASRIGHEFLRTNTLRGYGHSWVPDTNRQYGPFRFGFSSAHLAGYGRARLWVKEGRL